jgi:hypothetical protein
MLVILIFLLAGYGLFAEGSAGVIARLPQVGLSTQRRTLLAPCPCNAGTAPLGGVLSQPHLL